MKTKPLIGVVLLLILLGSVGDFAAQSKRKRRPKPNPLDKPFETPCGIKYKNTAELLDEWEVEWRSAAEAEDQTFFYNTRKQNCDKGIVKAWIKAVQKDASKTLSYSLIRYELNCRSDQLRLVSLIKYKKDGAVLDSDDFADNKDNKWSDPVPSSIGESILETVCHKSL